MTIQARPTAGRTAPLARMLRPFQEFARTEAAGGIVLLVCTAVALLWANSPWSESYFAFWHRPITFGIGGSVTVTTIAHTINDGLMAVFFFLVGLEIKREMLVGELASRQKAALPVAAALGGMLVPALIFTVFNFGTPGLRGWGVPVATDIAFALGVASLLGRRVPPALRVFLAALAIADDIGAVVVIALFYTSDLALGMLLAAVGVLVLLTICNAMRIRSPAVYTLLGIALWGFFLASGVHSTVAGVLLAFMIPSRTMIDDDEFIARVRDNIAEFERASGPETTVLSNREQLESVHALESACEEIQAPLIAMENKLHGWVAFGIMPLFAIANAGVSFGAMRGAITWNVTLGIVLGLVIGKPLGITLFAWLSERLKLATRPAGISWRALHGVSWLGGIGFTMSLFIGSLAFERTHPQLLTSAKLGVLIASVVAGVAGWLVLRTISLPPRNAPDEESENGIG
jgi:Na+:H+ antiporter, NhaA family